MDSLAKLNECKSLMQRICNLPDNHEELKKKGSNDDDIETLENSILLWDPEANAQVKRIKEIMNKVETGNTLFQGK